MKSSLKDLRQPPRKVRYVADSVRGKNAMLACESLRLLNKKSAAIISKLIKSAISNAKDKNVSNTDSLMIKKIMVDSGITMIRGRARAMGRSTRIRKRTSRVLVELEQKEEIKNNKK